MTAEHRSMSNARQPLTERQRAIYDFIRRHVRQWQRPPTYRDIGLEFCIGSPNGIRHHLDALAKKQWIEIDENVSCGIRLTNVKVTIEDV